MLELYEVDIWKDFCFGDGALFSPDGAGSTNPRLEFSHLAGRYRPGESPFLSPVCGGASSTSPGLEFPHRAGRYRPFSSPVCWSCRYVEGFLIGGWELILPGCGGTSALARGATLAARWLHEPLPISNHPLGLGFLYPAGRYRPGVSSFSSTVCWSCRCMEGFLMRGWELILPGCPGSMYDPQPISDRPLGLGFPHRAGRCRPGGSPFSSPGCRSCRRMERILIREWDSVVPGWRWLSFLFSSPSQSAIVWLGWGF